MQEINLHTTDVQCLSMMVTFDSLVMLVLDITYYYTRLNLVDSPPDHLITLHKTPMASRRALNVFLF